MDFVAPAYIAFLAFFFVFLLTCVSFLRERSQGTMERLLATPASRLEIVVGYIGGLSLFAADPGGGDPPVHRVGASRSTTWAACGCCS